VRYHGEKLNDYVIEDPAYELGDFIFSDKTNYLQLCAGWLIDWCQIYLRSFMLQKKKIRRSLNHEN